MKIVVTGGEGQLAKAIKYVNDKHDVFCFGSDQCDVTDREATIKTIRSVHPEIVLHCAAYTAVDKAEENIDYCFKVNATGTAHVALACAEINAKMVLLSTDYVFNDTSQLPYETDEPLECALNVYGNSKIEAEKTAQQIVDKLFVIRTSWMFGQGCNFVQTMLKLSETRKEISVIEDQIGSPTYAQDLAILLYKMIVTDKYGIYHVTNEGFCSWADLAEQVFTFTQNNVSVKRISSNQYPAAALRPKNSRLSKTCLDEQNFKRLPTWQNALERYLKSDKGCCGFDG